jgi:hypothetical protein
MEAIRSFAYSSVAIDNMISASNYPVSGLQYRPSYLDLYNETIIPLLCIVNRLCVYSLSSNAALPNINISLGNQLTFAPYSTSCNSEDLSVLLTCVTQARPPLGMQYGDKAQLVPQIEIVFQTATQRERLPNYTLSPYGSGLLSVRHPFSLGSIHITSPLIPPRLHRPELPCPRI